MARLFGRSRPEPSLRSAPVDRLLDDIGRAYDQGIQAPGKEVHFLVLLAFVASFGFIRTSAHMIKAQVSWWPGNIETKGGGQPLKGTFRASKEKVTVPAGTYDTIHVKGTGMTVGNTSSDIDYWFAKDVGIVKLRFTLGSQDATLELEKYEPGK